MSRLSGPLKNQPRSLVILGALLTLVLIAGLGLSTIVMVVTIRAQELQKLSICLQSGCVKEFTENIEAAISVAKATLDIGIAIATIGGIFVALLSYLNSASNAALTNHIEHLKVFSEYIEKEIEKRDRLAENLFDTLLLYGSIFSQSRNGKTTVSNDYIQFMIDLNKIIDESNQRSIVGTPGGFSYNDHQRRVREHLKKIGVTIYSAPRNDYFETEAQLFSLLHRVNQSFCPPGVVPEIGRSTYY